MAERTLAAGRGSGGRPASAPSPPHGGSQPEDQAKLTREVLDDSKRFWRFFAHEYGKQLINAAGTAACAIAVLVMMVCVLGTATALAIPQPGFDMLGFLRSVALITAGIGAVATAVVGAALGILYHWRRRNAGKDPERG